jgi:hypothetical protein
VKIGYADPPYPGMAKLYEDHEDYGGEVDHGVLIDGLVKNYDAFILHTASTTLATVLAYCPEDVRVGAWVKPFASWKRGVYPAYAWEPVIFHGGRNLYGQCQTVPDFVAEPITLKRGLTGAKPEAVCLWAFGLIGANIDDELDDIFPGSGAVTAAWQKFQRATALPFPSSSDDPPQLELVTEADPT